jgi:hypothetical protein
VCLQGGHARRHRKPQIQEWIGALWPSVRDRRRLPGPTLSFHLNVRRCTRGTSQLQTKSSIRDVPLGPALREALLCYRGSAPDEALVFASKNDAPLNAKNTLRRWITDQRASAWACRRSRGTASGTRTPLCSASRRIAQNGSGAIRSCALEHDRRNLHPCCCGLAASGSREVGNRDLDPSGPKCTKFGEIAGRPN